MSTTGPNGEGTRKGYANRNKKSRKRYDYVTNKNSSYSKFVMFDQFFFP